MLRIEGKFKKSNEGFKKESNEVFIEGSKEGCMKGSKNDSKFLTFINFNDLLKKKFNFY